MACTSLRQAAIGSSLRLTMRYAGSFGVSVGVNQRRFECAQKKKPFISRARATEC